MQCEQDQLHAAQRSRCCPNCGRVIEPLGRNSRAASCQADALPLYLDFRIRVPFVGGCVSLLLNCLDPKPTAPKAPQVIRPLVLICAALPSARSGEMQVLNGISMNRFRQATK